MLALSSPAFRSYEAILPDEELAGVLLLGFGCTANNRSLKTLSLELGGSLLKGEAGGGGHVERTATAKT